MEELLSKTNENIDEITDFISQDKFEEHTLIQREIYRRKFRLVGLGTLYFILLLTSLITLT